MTALTKTVEAHIKYYEPPLPNVFSGSLLSADKEYDFPDNTAVSRWLLEQSLSDLGGQSISKPSPAANDMLSDMMVQEALYALERTDVPTAANWYTEAIERMISVAGVLHPEINSDEAAASHPCGMFKDREEARTVLFCAMAITSQGITVQDNMRYAIEQYREFLQHGEFKPKPYGANGVAVEGNLRRFNFLLKTSHKDLSRLKRLLNLKLRMKDLVRIAGKYGIEIAGKELADELVYGSMIFGPKVGNGFLQNLMGNYSPVTIDLWFMRLWGRYTGTLVRDEYNDQQVSRLVKGVRRAMKSQRMSSMMEAEGLAVTSSRIREMDAHELLDYSRRAKRFWEKLRKKYVAGAISDVFTERSPKQAVKNNKGNAESSEFKSRLEWPGAAESLIRGLGQPVDVPRNASLRRWIRDVVALSIDKLKDYGYEITAADLQAILWYPEKEIYGRLSGRPAERLNMSYDDAIIRIAKQEGITDVELEAALQSVGTDRGRGPAGSGCYGDSFGGADDGLRGGTSPDGGQSSGSGSSEVEEETSSFGFR